MPKYTAQQRAEISSIVADLTIKRIPDQMIIKHIENTVGQAVSRSTLWNVRKRLKKESYDWYSKLREGQYEYLHEFKERINEIVDLQRQHHEIILKNQHNPSVVQTSLAALHKLNVTLSSYYNIVPYLTVTGQRQDQRGTEAEGEAQTGIRVSQAGHRTRMPLAENCRCILNGVHSDTVRHIECRSCLHIWCPNALGGQDWCPNPECKRGIRGNEFEPYDEDHKWIECDCGMWFKTEEVLQAHLTAYPHNQ